MGAMGGKAFRHLQLGRLDPVSNVGEVGGSLEDLAHQRSFGLVTELKLQQSLLEG